MAEATDILTFDEALEAIGATNVGDNSLALERMVSAVSQVIDSMCGPVVAREVTEVHEGSVGAVWLFQPPVLSVTSVSEFDGTTTTALTDESAFGTVGGTVGFVLSSDGSRIERRSGGYGYSFARQVQVTYQAGRYADTDSVGARWKQAAAAILARMWKREGSAWAYSPDFYANTDEQATSTGFFRAVAPMVDEFLWDEKLPPAVA